MKKKLLSIILSLLTIATVGIPAHRVEAETTSNGFSMGQYGIGMKRLGGKVNSKILLIILTSAIILLVNILPLFQAKADTVAVYAYVTYRDSVTGQEIYDGKTLTFYLDSGQLYL